MIEKVTTIIRDYKDDENLVIERNTNLIKELALSSLDTVELVCMIEDELDLEIPIEELKDFRIVDDIVSYLHRNEAAIYS